MHFLFQNLLQELQANFFLKKICKINHFHLQGTDSQ
jgi:hypothetical protein